MQKLQISIPEPCHENWQQMTPTEQGRFCNACAKEVVDFSMMTDTEVLNYFTKITHEKVCGRALPSQLERTITTPKEPKKKLFWYWNYIVMFFMFFKGNNAAAQTCTKPPTEAGPVKNSDVRGEVVAVGKIKQEGSRVITGKVTDMDGNPVSFASVKIKGTPTGVSADANGAYLIRGYSNTILVIAGLGFKEAEIPVGNGSTFNIVLEKSVGGIVDIIVVGGAFGRITTDEYYGSLDKLKRIAVIQVKDETTGKVMPNASIIMKPRYGGITNTVLTDKKGIYKIKGIADGDEYEIRISAEGYEPSEFTIDEYDFKNRKKEWEVLLKKQKSAFAMQRRIATQDLKGDFQVNVLGQTRVTPIITDSLYVIDGKISTKREADHLSPEDISEITRLEKSEAAALFGSEGSNGAVVITTRKAKEIKLNEVVVSTDLSNRRMGGMTGGITFTREGSYLDEKITTVKTLLTDSIKVYPNPVQRNNEFSVQLKLKQPGNNYSFLITDVTGKVLLQQQFNASAKDHTVKITGDGRWAAGIYYIRVFDSKNKLISKSSFIFQ